MTNIEDKAMNLEILIYTNNERIYKVKNLILLPIKNIRYLISHQISDGKQYQFKCERKDVVYKINKTSNSGIKRLGLNEISIIPKNIIIGIKVF